MLTFNECYGILLVIEAVLLCIILDGIVVIVVIDGIVGMGYILALLLYEDMGVLYSYVVQFSNLRLTGGVVSDVMRLPLYYKIGVVKC